MYIFSLCFTSILSLLFTVLNHVKVPCRYKELDMLLVIVFTNVCDALG